MSWLEQRIIFICINTPKISFLREGFGYSKQDLALGRKDFWTTVVLVFDDHGGQLLLFSFIYYTQHQQTVCNILFYSELLIV